MENIKNIYYVGYYVDKAKDRYCPPSAVTKMEYIISKFQNLNYNINIISPSQLNSGCFGFQKKSYVEIKKGVTLKLSTSFSGKGVIYKVVKYIWINIWIFYQLLIIPKNSIVVYYHSLDLLASLVIAKKIKRHKLIIECEEIYNDVYKHHILNDKFERKALLKGDAYIFPTELLKDKLAISKQPCSIIYGSYHNKISLCKKYQDGCIHIVYAGILEESKGVFTAIGIAKYLDSKHVIHILGYGSKEDIDKVTRRIKNSNLENKCKIEFHGLLMGTEYDSFLSKCHIGISPQDKNAIYNESSFPSKILSYLTHGLTVVSVSLPTIEVSSLNKVIICYSNDELAEIAKLVQSVKINHETTEEVYKVIEMLDNNCEKNLGELVLKLRKGQKNEKYCNTN